MNTSLSPTLLPNDWTAAKEKAFCDAHGGARDMDSLFAEVLRARRKLGDNLNNVLAAFEASVEGCSVAENLFMLENIARADTLHWETAAELMEERHPSNLPGV